MVENVASDKIESASERGSQSYISLSEAGVRAVRTARASAPPRRWILRRRMLFDVLNDHEDEDTYTVVVGFRPEGDFEGTPVPRPGGAESPEKFQALPDQTQDSGDWHRCDFRVDWVRNIGYGIDRRTYHLRFILLLPGQRSSERLLGHRRQLHHRLGI